MTSLGPDLLKSTGRRCPHGEKQWQLNSTSRQPTVTEELLVAAETRLSTWTPMNNKPSNRQLFQERTTLILHWFDLWTDRQRKQFIHNTLTRCSRSQLKFVRDWFMEVVPVTRADFTTLLPRYLSLYILSFLNPMELCIVAQVSWHWKFLAEQDCLWVPKCVRHGWFLPYTPVDTEYGAWKRHYIACVSNLDYLTPREATDLYGTLNESLQEAEELEERQKERWIRQAIREKVEEHKRTRLKSRRVWLSNSWSAGTPSTKVQENKLRASVGQQSLTAALVHFGDRSRSQCSLSQLLAQEARGYTVKDSVLEKTRVVSKLRSLPRGKSVCGSYTLSTRRLLVHPHSNSHCHIQGPLHLLLVSSRVPAYELVLSGARVGVVPLLYDHSGTTLESLLFRAESLLQGRNAQSVGVLAEGGTEDISLLQGCSITERTLLKPDVRDFWEKLSGWVVPLTEGGSFNIFAPIAASVKGMQLISKLSTLTGLSVNAPTGIATGSYQHILSQWSGRAEFPPRLYFNEALLVNWCRQAEWLEETLRALRDQLGPQLQQLCHEIRGRALGQFLYDAVGLFEIHRKSELTQALSEGLVALSRERCENPLQFLSEYLQRRCQGDYGSSSRKYLTEDFPTRTLSHTGMVSESTGTNVDRRTAVAEELFYSEGSYMQLLEIVAEVYHGPLRAALSSNRAILSSANVLTIFSSVLDILEVNNVFLEELAERLEDWSPVQCVGDVCLKLCSKLGAYTNFFNNYATILRTIDRCREMIPVFRAFLKRHDRTPATKMMSLQELLLLPSSRVEEYVMLLQALSLHTAPEHPDQPHLSSALDALCRYRNFICKLKQSIDGDAKILETQKSIQSCPNLQEGNRHLIAVQEVMLLGLHDVNIAASLRVYEHVSDLGLFLFNDALVLSERRVSHLPFGHASKTSHTFLASVALHRLVLRDISDTRYVQNAFVLEGPKRQWTCATEKEEDKVKWLSALKKAISAAIGEN